MLIIVATDASEHGFAPEIFCKPRLAETKENETVAAGGTLVSCSDTDPASDEASDAKLEHPRRRGYCETERKQCAKEKEKSETATVGWTLKGKPNDQFTCVVSDGAADNQIEDNCRRGQCRRLEREVQRWHVFNGRGIEDKKKQKRLQQSARGRTRVIFIKGWWRSHTRRPFFPQENISQPRVRSKVQNASGAVPQVCGRRKTGARRGRRGRRGKRTIPEPELQSRPTCIRWRSPIGGTSLLPTSVRKAGWTKTRAIVEGPKGMAKASSDKVETTTAKNEVVWDLLGNGEKQETFDGDP